ncbi:hypothetical protein QR680_002257 [Steinernema hermaphroditum]|uniref:L-aminoadipate-semialdehyde dehydrogenase-phosphopantetheinyl transferase n=1 Tax=Steinernema hermaphroditum TaxID=289476 RepID=A0AA39H222_9BILA|nr:hypothetical protein QR680_002257 [Steinernema hermaphroditum]
MHDFALISPLFLWTHHTVSAIFVSRDLFTFQCQTWQSPANNTCTICHLRVHQSTVRNLANSASVRSGCVSLPPSANSTLPSSSADSPVRSSVMSTSAQGKPECVCRRWAFSMKSAFENEQLETFYRKAVQSISPEQHERMVKYRHRDDALACLVGRLFLRQATRRFTGVDWHSIEFGRTAKGKPYLVIPEDTTFGINVSHQGDYVAFSSSCSSKVGVDCMRLDIQRNNKTADEYINSMAKSASAEELRMMRSQPTDQMKMTIFYRYWEAICKATGEGIPNDLSTIDFRVDTSDRYRPGCFVTSTAVRENGKEQEQWVFEESFIDTTHSVAVCREKALPRHCTFRKDPESKLFFSKIDFDFLLDGATVINPLPDSGAEDFENFMKKPRKTF